MLPTHQDAGTYGDPHMWRAQGLVALAFIHIKPIGTSYRTNIINVFTVTPSLPHLTPPLL